MLAKKYCNFIKRPNIATSSLTQEQISYYVNFKIINIKIK